MNNYVENAIESMQMFNIFTPQPDTFLVVIYIFFDVNIVFATLIAQIDRVFVCIFPPLKCTSSFRLLVNIMLKNDRCLKSDFKYETSWEFNGTNSIVDKFFTRNPHLLKGWHDFFIKIKSVSLFNFERIVSAEICYHTKKSIQFFWEKQTDCFFITNWDKNRLLWY